jgi:hypothetical protein
MIYVHRNNFDKLCLPFLTSVQLSGFTMAVWVLQMLPRASGTAHNVPVSSNKNEVDINNSTMSYNRPRTWYMTHRHQTRTQLLVYLNYSLTQTFTGIAPCWQNFQGCKARECAIKRFNAVQTHMVSNNTKIACSRKIRNSKARLLFQILYIIIYFIITLHSIVCCIFIQIFFFFGQDDSTCCGYFGGWWVKCFILLTK